MIVVLVVVVREIRDWMSTNYNYSALEYPKNKINYKSFYKTARWIVLIKKLSVKK